MISNDDGFFAKGINFLIDTLKDEADIIVVAPDSARSGYALAITSMLPVQRRRAFEGLCLHGDAGRLHKVGFKSFSGAKA